MGFSAKQKEKEQSIYNVKELEEDGYLYDDTGIYIPYNPDPRDIYLKISRNPDKKCELIYAWVMKKEDMLKKVILLGQDNTISLAHLTILMIILENKVNLILTLDIYKN